LVGHPSARGGYFACQGMFCGFKLVKENKHKQIKKKHQIKKKKKK
jgi:hypothetical protein